MFETCAGLSGWDRESRYYSFFTLLYNMFYFIVMFNFSGIRKLESRTRKLIINENLNLGGKFVSEDGRGEDEMYPFCRFTVLS